MSLRTAALHPRFGVEVFDVNLDSVTADRGYPEIRQAFETHSLLLFRNQSLSDESHLTFSELFGPIENRQENAWGKRPDGVGLLSNVQEGGQPIPDRDRRLAQLKSNHLWHTDSTFLPVPALANILTARVTPSRGGETEFASTRAALHDMPDELKTRATDAHFWHSYAHSRAQIDPELAKENMIARWPAQCWKGVWENPVNGESALYIASHVYGVEGMDQKSAKALIDQLTHWAVQPQYVYRHNWKVGDVLVWDERATLHRGRPWPYNEERTLASICVSAREEDGLGSIRP